VVDSTVFSTLFGGDESLERFWRNLATAEAMVALRRRSVAGVRGRMKAT
jgi:hypothetical protein